MSFNKIDKLSKSNLSSSNGMNGSCAFWILSWWVFWGLFPINNDSPTNISKAKAYLKRFESFESNPLYLDSAFAFLEKTLKIESYPYFIQYYYLKNDFYSIINYHLASSDLDYVNFSDEVISLALSRVGEAYSKNGLIREAIFLFKKSINLSPYIIDYQLKK